MRRPIASGTVETEFRVMYVGNSRELRNPIPVDSSTYNTREEAFDRIMQGVSAGNRGVDYSLQRRIIVRTETAWEEVE